MTAEATVIDWPADPVPDPPSRRLRTVSIADVQMRSIEWLDKPHLQRSAFHLVAGPKGVGKGTWLAKIAAGMTRGIYGDSRSVLFVSSEDSVSIDLKPRLVAAGADVDRVFTVTSRLTLPTDLDELRALALDLGDVGMIVLDPIGNHLDGGDTDKEGYVRYAIAGLNRLADELDCVVLGVRHIGKSRQNGALASVLGSVAWVDLPRAVLMFARDDEDEMVFHVAVAAGNRSGHGAGQAFRIELRDVGLKEPVTCAVALGESTKSVDDLLATNRPERGQKRADVKELILRELAAGPQTLDRLKYVGASEAGASGETVYRAANELKAEGKAKPRNNGPGTKWYWHLEPGALASSDEAANPHGYMTSSHATNDVVSDSVTESDPSLLDSVSSAHTTKSAAKT